MPKLDKTGPEGKGPNTGRSMGNCIDETTCNNGMRKRCCRNINPKFYQQRKNRINNSQSKGDL